MSVFEYFKYDYERMTETDCKRFSPRVLFNLLFRHNLRCAYWYRKRRAGSKLARIAMYRMSRKFGLEISPDAEIGKGLYLGHPYNITVGMGVKMGDNINLHKGCTIGNIMTGKRKGSPTIGNCVSVGINATIVGGVTIGNDVFVAPNAFVNFDVPDHSVVIGNPGIIHHKENATEFYILNKV